MIARIFKNQIHITPKPTSNEGKLFVSFKSPLNEYSYPKAYTNINSGQKVYELPETNRKNITGVFITLKVLNDIKK